VDTRISQCLWESCSTTLPQQHHRVWKVEGYNSTYVTFEDKEHQVTDSARCVQGLRANTTGGARCAGTVLQMWCLTWRYVARISATLPPILDEDFRYFSHLVKANGGIKPSRTRDRHFANLCFHTSFDASWTSSLRYGRANQQLGSMWAFCMSSRNITKLNNTCPTRLQRLLPTTPSRSRSSRNITQSVRKRSIKLRLLTVRLDNGFHGNYMASHCRTEYSSHSPLRESKISTEK